jgi:hypothetical protein
MTSNLYHNLDDPQHPVDHGRDADGINQAPDNPWSMFHLDNSPRAVKRRDRARQRDYVRLSQSESAGRGMFCHTERIASSDEELMMSDDPPDPFASPLGLAHVCRLVDKEVWVLLFRVLSVLSASGGDVAETLLTLIETLARSEQRLSVVFSVRPDDHRLINFLRAHGYKHPDLKYRADPPPQKIQLRKTLFDVLAGQRPLFRRSPHAVAQ